MSDGIRLKPSGRSECPRRVIENFEIRGGAGEFEAAVVAIVLDNVAREQVAARAQAPGLTSDLPAWIRATPQAVPDQPQPLVTPDRR